MFSEEEPIDLSDSQMNQAEAGWGWWVEVGDPLVRRACGDASVLATGTQGVRHWFLLTEDLFCVNCSTFWTRGLLSEGTLCPSTLGCDQRDSVFWRAMDFLLRYLRVSRTLLSHWGQGSGCLLHLTIDSRSWALDPLLQVSHPWQTVPDAQIHTRWIFVFL